MVGRSSRGAFSLRCGGLWRAYFALLLAGCGGLDRTSVQDDIEGAAGGPALVGAPPSTVPSADAVWPFYARDARTSAYLTLPDGDVVLVGSSFGPTAAALGRGGETRMNFPMAAAATMGLGSQTEATTWMARLRADGSAVWVREVSKGITRPLRPGIGLVAAPSPDGEIVFAASESGGPFPITFGLGQPNAKTFDARSESQLSERYGQISRRLYLARHAANGSFRWVTEVRSPNCTMLSPRSLIVAADGSALLTGDCGYVDQRQTDDLQLGVPKTALAGPNTFFVARFDADGELRWLRDDWLQPALVGNAGPNEFVLIGTFMGTATFGAGDPGEVTLTSGSSSREDLFVARVSLDDGSLTSAARGGGPLSPWGSLVVVRPGPDGAVYVAGAFAQQPLVLGPGSARKTTLEVPMSAALPFNSSNNAGFLARYRADGEFESAFVTMHGTYDIANEDVVISETGDIVMAGSYDEVVVLGAAPGPTVVLEEGDELSNSAAFLVRYTSDGMLQGVLEPTAETSGRVDGALELASISLLPLPDDTVLWSGFFFGRMELAATTGAPLIFEVEPSDELTTFVVPVSP